MKTKIEVELSEEEFKEAISEYVNKMFSGINTSSNEVRIESAGLNWCTASISIGDNT